MVWLILGIAGSVLFGIERYRYWRGDKTAGHARVILKSIGAALGMLAVIALITFIAWTYWL